MKLRILLTSLVILTAAGIEAKEPTYNRSSLGKASAIDPVINRARGYMSKGELQFATHNYGSFIEFEDYASPSGLYKGYQYISDVSLILGAPGKDADGNIYPWALRPPFDEVLEHFISDTVVYWGATVSESWFDRVQDKKQVDWESAENHLGFLHSGEVASGEVYGGLYTDTGDPYPLLATSDIPTTWPMLIDPESGKEQRTWPGDWAVITDLNSPAYGQPIVGRHVGDQDIYMEFDDRLVDRDEDRTQGYSMGMRVRVNAHSYGRSYAEDIAFFTVEIINESYKGFKMDLNGDGEPDSTWVPVTDQDGNLRYTFQSRHFQGSADVLPDGSQHGFNYTDIYGGFYFDVDSYSRLADGRYTGRSNDDDMMAFDTEYDMAYIWDWDDDSNGRHDLAYSALKLLDTPDAPYDLDLDGDGTFDVLAGEPLGLTDWHWFDWYDRPGVYDDEKAGGSCGGDYAGVAGCPGAVDKEAIQFALMAGDTAYARDTFHDWEWRGIPDGDTNPNGGKYDSWYFHAASDGTVNPHFDSLEGLLQEFPDGLDCVFIMSAGPFNLAVGDTTYFSFAVIMGDPPDDTETFETPPDLAANAEMAQIMYDLKYQGFSPPDAPTVSAAAGDGVVTLYWDSAAEFSTDIVTEVDDFEGYKIYRSTDGGLTWGDPDDDVIYDSDQQAVGWKPLAQFDLTEEEDERLYGKEYSGPDDVAPWFSLGTNSGIEHRYVDDDVINGVTYSYAVVAYDIGIDSTDDYTSANGEWGINLEYLENFKGNSPLLPQFVTVTPNAKPSNAPDVTPVERSATTMGTGELEILPTDVDKVQETSARFRLTVTADPRFKGGSDSQLENNPLMTGNARYAVYNEDTGDTLIGWIYDNDGNIDSIATRNAQRYPVEMGTASIFGSPWSGFQMFSVNMEEAQVDTVSWRGRTESNSPTYYWEFTNRLGFGFAHAADYMFIWGQEDTTTNGRVLPFTVWNVNRDAKVNITPSYANTGLPANDDYPDFVNRMALNFKEYNVPGFDSTRYKTTWKATVSWLPDSLFTNLHYSAGDTLDIFMDKPFHDGDEFYFESESITEMKEVVQDHLKEVKVVPNPYIVTAAWERDINHKNLHFTHLPDECVIKIFTLTGELIYTILHNDIFSGQAEWNLRTMNRQEVAPGLYVFTVETPNKESYVGKFAVIR